MEADLLDFSVYCEALKNFITIVDRHRPRAY
jgi:hypothetical protein